ncbi:MAG TPA: S1C family serine protease [Streptosporangiaceae bacterium]|nr:S1C family serine protease [Streptosporangiaceae bacterium]
MGILDEVQASIKQLTETAGASVVGIGQRWGSGSGVVLGEGRVLTNAHNVRGEQVTVTFADGRTVEGSVTGHDVDNDLAVIDVDTAGAPALTWASNASAEIGMPVFALANPGGLGLRVTFGFVSGKDRTFRGPRGRRITGSLEHTAPLLPGSSGGPVLDAGGQLLGINTNRLGEGFYLAIPADEALRDRADGLARGESTASPRLGVGIAPGHVARRLRRAVGLPETEGLLIRDVADESPAARAGLAQGDLIVTAAGQPIRTPDDLFDALKAARGGIELKIVRGAEERTVQVTFADNGQQDSGQQES